MKNILLAFTTMICLICLSAFSADIVIIKPPEQNPNYSNEDLRRRVWDLERAVAQLQNKVFELEIHRPANNFFVEKKHSYTCYISSFGKTYTETAETKTQAKAVVLQQCAEATNAVHCHDDDVKCGD